MRESRHLEFKECVSNTFLKTVSAYANYGGGEILFGVADDGREVGLEDPAGDSLRIENAINDGVSPRPEFEVEQNPRTRVVTLRVREGDDKPYLYRSKAYRRSDTATVEVDSLELRRLVLEGSNRTFDELRSQSQDLSFEALEAALVSEVGIESFDNDTLRTLGLLSRSDGFNNAAPELDADERAAYALFAPGRVLSTAQVSEASGFGKDKTLRLLGQLVDKGFVRVQGAGRSTRYIMS